MRRLLFAASLLALVACGGTGDTSSGALTAAHNSGGFCQQSAAWCGWDLTVTANAVTIGSKGTTDTASGSLTTAGHDELAALVAALPIDSANDDSQTCADAPTTTLDITFETGGARTYSYSCTPGVFTDLGTLVADISGGLISGQGNEYVVVARALRGP